MNNEDLHHSVPAHQGDLKMHELVIRIDERTRRMDENIKQIDQKVTGVETRVTALETKISEMGVVKLIVFSGVGVILLTVLGALLRYIVVSAK